MPNRLGNEKSPYLLSHAHNPVDWYPWGDEAFAKAKAEEKPVFLSIGYSTCHWCHVMAHESFEDGDVASFLNEHFVSVKVDREERPDIDAVYMDACQALTGQGGWPLTVIMTPEQKPFYAATYLPKSVLLGLLSQVSELWQNRREKLSESADSIATHLKKLASSHFSSANPSSVIIENAVTLLKRSFDSAYGGFSPPPKFPSPHIVLFLLARCRLTRDQALLNMAETTLRCMYRGGIFDHIGGGFSRYSTDKRWLIPHFEKMLYDNALLTLAYAECSAATGKDFYKSTAYRICDYVFSELTDPSGGFYCGEDADSEGEEGRFYVFTPAEIASALGDEKGAEFCRAFAVTKSGNFEGKSVPNLIENPDWETAGHAHRESAETLRLYRKKRARLFKDDKILTAWTSLEIAALARAGAVFGDENLIGAAKKAEDFLRKRLMKPDGSLLARFRSGEVAIDGTLDDYAFYVYALLELYEARFDPIYLGAAAALARTAADKFFDFERGGFYLTADGAECLISRPKELYDGAMPSGNSVLAYTLERLSVLTGLEYWQYLSQKQLKFIAGQADSHPSAHCFALIAMQNALSNGGLLVCAVQNGYDAAKIRAYADKKAPGTAVIVKTPENGTLLEKIAPFTADYPVPDGGERYYLCRNGACLAPVDGLDNLP